MIPIRLYVYAATAIFLAYTLWHDHLMSRQRNAARLEATQAKADITAIQAAQAHERKIATEASNEFQRTVTALQAARADTPVRSVRLCRSPTGYVPAPSSGTERADAATANGLPETVGQHPGYGSSDRFSDAGPDIGGFLYALADEADEAVARCSALQGWAAHR